MSNYELELIELQKQKESIEKRIKALKQKEIKVGIVKLKRMSNSDNYWELLIQSSTGRYFSLGNFDDIQSGLSRINEIISDFKTVKVKLGERAEGPLKKWGGSR